MCFCSVSILNNLANRLTCMHAYIARHDVSEIYLDGPELTE